MRARSVVALLGALLLLAAAPAAAAEPATLTGTLSVIPAETADRAHDGGYAGWVLESGGRVETLADPQDEALIGRTVTITDADPARAGVQGVATAVEPSRGRKAQVAQSPLVNARARTLAVVRVVWTGSASGTDPATPDQVIAAFDGASGVNALFARQGSPLQLTGLSGGPVDVLPRTGTEPAAPLVLARRSTDCSSPTFYNGVMNDVLDALGSQLAGYDHVMAVFPHDSACGWAGLALMRGRYLWINGYFGTSFATSIIAHEIGHNLGANHAGVAGAACTVASATDLITLAAGECVRDEYGDRYSTMGAAVASPRLMSAWHRLESGQFDSDRAPVVTADGEYLLQDTNSVVSTGAQMLRLARPDGGTLLFELRRGIDRFDVWSDWRNSAVMVRLFQSPSRTSTTALLDMTPATPDGDDRFLTAGQTLTDASSGISVTHAGMQAGSVKLVVSRPGADPAGPGADPEPPTPPGDSGLEPRGPGLEPDLGAPSGDQGTQPPALDTSTRAPSRSGTPAPLPPFAPVTSPPAAAKAVHLAAPRLRRGRGTLPKNRVLRVAAAGAGRLSITAGKRRVQTDSSSARFKLTAAQRRRSTVRIVASRGSLAKSLRLTLRVRNGVLTVQR